MQKKKKDYDKMLNKEEDVPYLNENRRRTEKYEWMFRDKKYIWTGTKYMIAIDTKKKL